MKKSSTIFLKGVLILIGLAVLAGCVFVLPKGIMTDNVGYYRPILIGMYIPAVPFFIALYQGFKLLGYVDRDMAFSQQSSKALGLIKYCSAIIALLYGLALPYIYYAATQDDAPGVMLIGLIFTGTPAVVAIAAAMLQKLLRNTLTLKSENELTV